MGMNEKPGHDHEWTPYFSSPSTPEMRQDAYFDPALPRMADVVFCECGALGVRKPASRGRTLRKIVVVTNVNMAAELALRRQAWEILAQKGGAV